MKTYLTPKDNTWHTETIKTKRKPKVLCEECEWSGWCKDAPWVNGCKDGKINETK